MIRDRKVGLPLATALVASNMIGSGIFLLPATLAGTGSITLIGWLIATAGALLVAAVLAAQPGNSAMLNRQALIHAHLGDSAAAMDDFKRALRTVPAGGDVVTQDTVQYTLARLQAAAGDRDGAVKTLQGLLAGPTLADSEYAPLLTPATLRLNPEWDGLRQHPGFARLVEGNPQ